MAAVSSVWGSITTFLTDAWNVVSEAFSSLIDKVNTVVFPCLKEAVAVSTETVQGLDSHDWTVLGVGAGVAAAVTTAVAACFCKPRV